MKRIHMFLLCLTIASVSAVTAAQAGRPTAGGAKQVTYAGHPLYLYSGDSGPDETAYVGEKEFGGFWYAINTAGHTVK